MIKADRGWWAGYRFDYSPQEVERHMYPVVGWSDDGDPLIAHPDTSRLVVADTVQRNGLESGQAWKFQGVEYVEPRVSHGVFTAPLGWMYEEPNGRREPVIGFFVHDRGVTSTGGEGLFMTADVTPIVVTEDGRAHEAAYITGHKLIPPTEDSKLVNVSSDEASRVAMLMLGMAVQIDHVLALEGIGEVADPGGILTTLRNQREHARRYTSAARRLMGEGS